ncbi:hypothetical protein JW868_04565 [Candidatus Woesearchaeota archaeon]|nr:hypothetical protein [Candidatus Woesearchaeota archaeon]
MGDAIKDAVKKGNVVMVELPTNRYFEASVSTIKTLTDNKIEGVYLSFQRPYRNLVSMFQKAKIDVSRILFIDAAVLLTKSAIPDENCIHVNPDLDVDEIVRAIYMGLENLKSEKKFIFIDSLSTIALYKPLSETLRFSEFLIRTVKKHKDAEKLYLIFNVAKDLSQKRFIKDIAMKVDEVVEL